VWVGMDISPAMLDVAVEREVGQEGHMTCHDKARVFVINMCDPELEPVKKNPHSHTFSRSTMCCPRPAARHIGIRDDN
jgi:hypothetical protein